MYNIRTHLLKHCVFVSNSIVNRCLDCCCHLCCTASIKFENIYKENSEPQEWAKWALRDIGYKANSLFQQACV
jgi:hypothetical protein